MDQSFNFRGLVDISLPFGANQVCTTHLIAISQFQSKSLNPDG